MSISGIGSNNNYLPSALTTPATGANAAGGANALDGSSPADGSSDGNSAMQFLTNYLKETPAQRMVDSWLAQHHLTEKQLDAMPPKQQQAIRKQMAEDIKKKVQEQTGGGAAPAGSALNVTA
jgi:hypothetical protein